MSIFDRQSLLFALRLTASTILALAVANWVGLPNSYWAAMTVWIVAQPTRGMMIERNFYRLLGTGVGTAIAFCLLALTKNSFIVISVLSFLMVICVGIGNLVSSSKSYGVLLVGYTVAIVILPDISDLAHPHDLPEARVASTVIGVLVSMLVGAMFAPRSPRKAFASRAVSAGSDTFLWAAGLLEQGLSASDEQGRTENERRLIREIAEIEGMIDAMAAGSPDAHKRMRYLRVFLLELVNVMAIARTLSKRALAGSDQGKEIGWHLRKLADELHSSGDIETAKQVLLKACEQASLDNVRDAPVLDTLAATITRAVKAMRDFSRDASSLARVEYTLHRDVSGAIRAAIRAYLSFTLVAVIWLLTGWQGGPYTLMGMSIFLLVFSTFPNPQKALMGVFYGTIIGAVVAVFCRWVMLRYATDYLDIVMILVPFTFLGALARAYPRTAGMAIDYGMTIFVVSQPILPLHGDIWFSLSIAQSMTIAVAIVIVSFYVVPTNQKTRSRDLKKALADDLQQLAAGKGDRETGKRLTRMLHRSLRFVASADKRLRFEGVIASIAAAHAIRRLQFDLKEEVLTGEMAVECRKVLSAIADKDGEPEAMLSALAKSSESLRTLQAESATRATVEDIIGAMNSRL